MNLQIPSWLGDQKDLIVITRFLGTTPDSSNISKLLASICQQITRTTGYTKAKIPLDTSDLQLYFLDLLADISNTYKVVILLDSLDQLSEANNAYKYGDILLAYKDLVVLYYSTSCIGDTAP